MLAIALVLILAALWLWYDPRLAGSAENLQLARAWACDCGSSPCRASKHLRLPPIYSAQRNNSLATPHDGRVHLGSVRQLTHPLRKPMDPLDRAASCTPSHWLCFCFSLCWRWCLPLYCS